MPTFDTDLAIVGFGSAGMTAAELAVTLGRRVTVIERDRVGGDCLWTGCVPSKALIAAADVAHRARHADRFGLPAMAPDIDLDAVWRRVRAVREEIASGDDDPARFEAMGIEIRYGEASVAGPHELRVVAADGATSTITAEFLLLCPGSQPAVPDIAGLADAGYLTNETIFELDDVPGRMVFIGGGPIAAELAQAVARLGVEVTILQRGPRLLAHDEPSLVAALTTCLRADGVEVATGVDVVRVEPGPHHVVVGRIDGEERRWPTDAVVVATGRCVDTIALGLDDAGVTTDERGVVVDDHGRTNVASIYAAGDVTGREQFTHAAAHHAAAAVRDAFAPGRGPSGALVPWATFTDPALAHAGLTITQANDEFGARHVRVHRWSLAHNDRAHTDDATGEIVLVERTRLLGAELVGAHVLGPAAGEVIGELVLAIERGLAAKDLAGIVHVYPTIATSIQQIAGRAAMDDAARYRGILDRYQRARRWYHRIRTWLPGRGS